MVFLALGLLDSKKSLSYEALDIQEFKKMKASRCMFVHVWAAWCTICVQEMPALIRFLETKKNITPVVIDASHSLAQEQFSKSWLKTLNPKFRTFYKHEMKDEVLMGLMGAKWTGALPHSALFKRGVKKKEWVGLVSHAELDGAFQKECD
jgi:thiol-disulfide isomerase/thioredoxin